MVVDQRDIDIPGLDAGLRKGIETVIDILIAGVVLVSIILYVFLGHFRTAMIVALPYLKLPNRIQM